ncbi:MAG: hypothetical protein V1777_04460 [Candidatus Micrarchaeota archaeon]
MISKQGILTLVLLLLVATSCQAVTIQASDKIVTGSNWSFSVKLDSTDLYYTLNVLLDSQKIGSLYSTNPPTFVPDPFNGSMINSSRFANQTLFVSLTGLSAGNHELRVETFNQENVSLQSQTKPFLAIEPVDTQIQTSMNQSVLTLQTQNTALVQSIEELKQTNAGLNNRLEQQNELLAEFQQKIKNLTSSLQSLQDNQSADKTVIQNLQTQLESVLAEQQSAKANTVTGFVGLRNATLLGIGVLVVIAVGFFVYRQRKKSAY